MTGEWYAGIRQRVAALAASPAGGEVFGVLRHQWILEDPLTQDEPAELEAQTDLTPLLDDHGTPLTFARWYTRWLEKAEQAVQAASA